MAAASVTGFGAEHPPRPPDDVELRTIIDKLANFVARNGPEFEQMTMKKQQDNAKFQFLFGGEWHAYYKWRVMSEHQGQGSYQSQSGGGGGEGGKPPGGGGPILPLIRPLMSVGSYPQLPPNMPPYPPPPPLFGGPRGFPPGFNPNMRPPPLLPPSATTSSQSQPQSVNAPWKQHQAPPTNSQTTPTAPTHQLQLVREELQKELEIYGITDPMEVEFGKVVKQLMDSCTKDSIASGKSWILSHAELPNECAKVAKYLLRKTLDSPGVGFPEKLHIIYLINDVMHHCARKRAQDLHQAVEDLIVQMVFNVHYSSSGKGESLLKVCKIWENHKYFSDAILEQIRAIVDGEPRAQEVRESEVKDDQQQQSHPWEQREKQDQPPQPPWQQPPDQKQPPPWQQQPQADQKPPPPWQQSDQKQLPPWQQQPQSDQKPPLWQQQPQSDQKPPPPWQQQPQSDQQQNQQVVPRPPWQQDQQHKPPFMPPWQQQSQPRPPWDKPQDSNKPPILPWEHSQRPPPPWPPHHPDDPRMPPWSGPPGLPPAPWQQGPPCVGEPTPLFPPTKPGDPPSHPPPQDSRRDERGEGDGVHDRERNDGGSGAADSAPHNRPGSPDRPLPPHEDEGELERGAEGGHGMMQSFDYQHGRQFGTGFSENLRDEGPPHPREIFEYNHRPPPWDLPPMPPRMPPFDAWGPPPPPHLPPPPDLPPPLPYYDLPAGLMVAVVPLFEHGYRPLDPRDIRLPPPQPPSERLLIAVEEFYKPAADDTPRNEEGWEARALLDFYEAKHRAKTNRYRTARRLPPRRPRSRSRSRSRSHSRSPPPRRRRSRSHSRSRSQSPSHSRSRPQRSRSRSRSPARRYSDEQRSRSRSRSHSPRRSRHRRSRSRSPFVPIAEERSLPPPPPSMAVVSESRIGGGNVGHQLLKKMGWEEGAGLGAREQGIQEPIKGGEVRDKNDKYKGVGMDMRDPFELFRRNKSYTFNRRTAPPPPSP